MARTAHRDDSWISATPYNKPCHFFQKGHCSRGDECRYLHEKREISTPLRESTTPILEGRYKVELCRYYSQGYCGKGPDCTFAHGEHELKKYKGPPRFGSTGPVLSESTHQVPFTAPPKAPLRRLNIPPAPPPPKWDMPMAPTRKEQNPESLNHDLDKLSPITVHGPLQQNRFQVPSGEKANISSTKPQAIKTSRLFYDDDVDPLPVSLRPWVNNDTVEVPAPQKSAGRQLRARTILQELAAIGSRLAECDDFTCPITLQPFKDPVIAADGFTYERFAIQEWLDKHPVSPVTNTALQHTQLVQNRALLSVMTTWREADMDIVARVLQVEDCL